MTTPTSAPNSPPSVSRRRFLGNTGALGLGSAFLAASAGIVRAAAGKFTAPGNVPDLIFEKFEAGGISHYSYFIGDRATGSALVIDPQRDIDGYLDFAKKNEVKITHVVETHIHADFVSGLRELTKATGATGYASGEGGAKYGFPVETLTNGTLIDLGSVVLKAIHTPGHTPEHLAFLGTTREDLDAHWGLFTGDFLFPGAVGRPDLMGAENTGKLAHQLWNSLQTAFKDLPDDLPIYPAHGPGSPCGAGILKRDGAATLGTERKHNPAYRFTDEQAFIDDLLASQPPMPSYWPRLKRINARGPQILGSVPEPKPLSAKEFRELLTAKDVQLLDTRDMFAFGGGHVPGALNIGHSPSISMWGGWLLDPEKRVAIVPPADGDPREVARWLIRIGIEKFAGSLANGMVDWTKQAGNFTGIRQMSVRTLNERRTDPALQLLDVRTPTEWDQGHIPGARYLFLPEIPQRLSELDKSRPVVVYCGTGYRASIAASLLEREGFDVQNVPGSFTAWLTAGYDVEIPEKPGKASDTRRP